MRGTTVVHIEKKISFSFLITTLLLVSLLHPNVYAAVWSSNWTTSSPTIDGTIGAGEWDAAHVNSLVVFDAVTENPDNALNMWAMNDGANLYLRLQWVDGSYDGNTDAIVIFFDEDNNGNWTNTGIENAVAYAMNTTHDGFLDCYATTAYGPGYVMDAGTQDGAGAYSRVSTTYVVELSIPLGRADAEDLQPTAGAVIGFAVKVYNNLDVDVYPLGTDHNYTTVTFQLASEPGGIGVPYSIIFVIFPLLLVAILLQGRRRDSIDLWS